MSASAGHIVFVSSRLDLPGGIEKAIVQTANLFVEKGHPITIFICDETDACFYPLHDNINIICRPLSFGIGKQGNMFTRKLKLLSDVMTIRKVLKKLPADIVITTEFPLSIATLLSGIGRHKKIIAWEHHHFYELKKNKFWERLFQLTYPKLNAIICLNEDEQKHFSNLNKNVITIPNYIGETEKNITAQRQQRIITVARLTEVKGIHYLLSIATNLLKRYTQWEWKIIGDGELKAAVIKTINKEQLTGRLTLQAPVDYRLQDEYRQASLYALTSINECFPMTLLEAMQAGLPLIAFDCETGPRHIIANEKNGFLIQAFSTDKYIDAIEKLIKDDVLRSKMGEISLQIAKQFSADKIYEKWKLLFDQQTARPVDAL